MVAMSLIISPTLLTLSLGLLGPSPSIQVITSLHPKRCRAGIHNGAPVPLTFCPLCQSLQELGPDVPSQLWVGGSGGVCG